MVRPSGSRSNTRNSRRWILSELEPRLMLAGDAGAAVTNGPVATGSAATEISICDGQQDLITPAQAHANHLVIIDAAAGEIETLMEAVPAGADFAILDQTQDGIQQISAILQSRQELASIHLISHATEGQLQIGSTAMTTQTLQNRKGEIEAWGKAFAEGGDFLLYGCDLAAGESGSVFIRELATVVGVDVAASNDRTGNGTPTLAADWELEQHIGTIESFAVLDQDRLKQFSNHLNIEIYAAGSTGDELMELEINGQIVETWFVNGTDAENGQFFPYVVDLDGVSADDIRINFVNDLYDPAAGIDRNLRVDRIVVDGVTYETENSAVFSEGTFVDGVGITSGNLQAEYLNADGYFQFSSAGGSTGNPSGGNGSQIEVSLRGHTGTESAEVLLDGRVVAAYDNISTSGNVFSFEADGAVTADRIRVAFTNDNGGGGFDRNLDVDFLRIDGQTFQTEAATTFSTGTWLPQRRQFKTAFRQSENAARQRILSIPSR